MKPRTRNFAKCHFKGWNIQLPSVDQESPWNSTDAGTKRLHPPRFHQYSRTTRYIGNQPVLWTWFYGMALFTLIGETWYSWNPVPVWNAAMSAESDCIGICQWHSCASKVVENWKPSRILKQPSTFESKLILHRYFVYPRKLFHRRYTAHHIFLLGLQVNSRNFEKVEWPPRFTFPAVKHCCTRIFLARSSTKTGTINEYQAIALSGIVRPALFTLVDVFNQSETHAA